MKEFFDKNSPYAYQDMTARMVETIRKQYWKADEATEKKLINEYLESVAQHGVGCSGNTCGNARLSKYVVERAQELGVPTPLIEGFQASMRRATGQEIEDAAREVEEFVRRNEGAPPAEISKVTEPAPAPLQGYRMEVEKRDTGANRTAVVGQDQWVFGSTISVPFTL